MKKPQWWHERKDGVMVPNKRPPRGPYKYEHRRVRVIGNSRSGTDWFTRVLKASGLDVGHEFVGPDGTVSCYFFIDARRYPVSPTTSPVGRVAHVGESFNDYEFGTTLHIVRHPLKCIGSIWSTMQTQHQLWLEEMGVIQKGLKPKLLKSMHTWHAVNAICQDQADLTFQLEQTRNNWPKILKLLDLSQDTRFPAIPPSNKSRGIFKAKHLTWHMMRDLDENLTESIARMARNYGYNTPTSFRN